VGMHSFTIEGQTGSRVVLPYTQWLAQRAFEQIDKLNVQDRESINFLLKEIGGEKFINLYFRSPVTRENHKLVWR